MKICLDLRTAGAAPHGIARYGIEMTRALQSLGTSHHLVLLTARGSDLDGLGEGDTTVFPCSPRPYSLKEQLLVPFVVARLRPDIYHCPTYACPLFVSVPALFTIHDVLPLEYPQDFSIGLRLYHKSVVRWMTKRARRIVTDSSYTSAAICRRFSAPRGKVRVIPLGGNHIGRQRVAGEDEERYREINPGDLDYFLSIANPRPHKNILFAIRCLLNSETLLERKVRYILVGQQHPSVFAYVKSRDPEGRIRFAGEVSEGLLRLLYGRAVALLCPSRGEGFCLPAVEGMQMGLPVIAANDGALPEVLGPAGLLLSLEDEEVWQEALEHIHATRKQGDWDPSPSLERASRLTWAKAAEKTLAVYEEIHSEVHAADI
jgi:glycosyltransferase involved in cell wall biosynthesis